MSLAAYRVEREQLKARLAKLDRVIAALEALEEGTTEVGAASPDRPDYRGRIKAVLTRNKPMTVKQIIDALGWSGFMVKTSDPYRTIYKVLKNAPTDFQHRGEKWCLKPEGIQTNDGEVLR